MKRLIVVMLLLSGCAGSSGVFQSSPNTYRIATRATWERGGQEGALKMAMQEATDFCAKQGKVPNMLNTGQSYGHFEGGQIDMEFGCVAKP